MLGNKRAAEELRRTLTGMLERFRKGYEDANAQLLLCSQSVGAEGRGLHQSISPDQD